MDVQINSGWRKLVPYAAIVTALCAVCDALYQTVADVQLRWRALLLAGMICFCLYQCNQFVNQGDMLTSLGRTLEASDKSASERLYYCVAYLLLVLVCACSLLLGRALMPWTPVANI